MIQSRHWLIVSGLFIISLVLFNVFSLEEKFENKGLKRDSEKFFDYTMNNVTRRQFDINGNLQTKIFSKNLFHYPDQNSVTLDHPTVELTTKSSEWELLSTRAIFNEFTHQLKLFAAVQLQSHNKDNGNKILLTTSELNVNLSNQQAFGPFPVQISNGQWHIQGVGIHIDINKQSLEILERVYSSNELKKN